MEINWFPGHMAKSMREIEESVAVCDVIVYVLDSRAARSCFNPSFDKLINKPTVYVLNKADTVEPDVVKGFIAALTGEKRFAVATDGTNISCRGALLSAIKRAGAATLERQKKRGLNAHLRAVVIGVPNTGKSTVINCLCKKSRLVTGDKAGVTRTARWARIDDTLDVLDTPGTLYPKISDTTTGENLAIIGSIKDEIADAVSLAVALINRLNGIDGEILKKRYGVPVTADDDGLCEVAKSRGYKISGGELDVERAASCVIDDYRKGRLGKIALERA